MGLGVGWMEIMGNQSIIIYSNNSNSFIFRQNASPTKKIPTMGLSSTSRRPATSGSAAREPEIEQLEAAIESMNVVSSSEF